MSVCPEDCFVLVLGVSAGEGCGEAGRNLEGHAQFDAFGDLADAGEGVYGVSGVAVVVEACALGDVVEVDVVCGQGATEAAVSPSVGDVGGEVAFAAQVAYESILDARCNENLVGQRCTCAVADVCGEEVASVNLVGCTGFDACIVKLAC